jgi:hypothetical protein
MTPGPPETLTTLVEEDLRPMAPWFDACGSSTTTHRGLDVSSWPQYRIDIKWSATDREEGCKKSSSGFSSSTFVLCCSSKRGRGKGKHFGVGGTIEDEVVQLL